MGEGQIDSLAEAETLRDPIDLLALGRGPVAGENRVDDMLHADRRRVDPEGDDDRVANDRGRAATGKAPPEERDALPHPYTGRSAAIDHPQPPRRTEQLPDVRKQDPDGVAIVGSTDGRGTAWRLRGERREPIARHHFVAGV